MILVIDNYDSFTYNLVQYLGEVSRQEIPIEVVRNDKITLDEIDTLLPTHIVISPGPCTPNEAGISMNLIRHVMGRVPVLGVCLGHQAIAQALGGNIVLANEVVHGKTTFVNHTGKGIFKGIENNFLAGRYHSLVACSKTLPQELEILAWSSDNEIMAIAHKTIHSLIGVQFHPESILTGVGKRLLANFLSLRTSRN